MDQGTSSSAAAERHRLLSDRRLLAIVKAFATLIVLPIVIGAIALSALINSTSGHAYLLRLLQQEATQSLGVAVHVENFNLHLSTLSLDLYGLTVDGAGAHPTPPLLQVQHAEAGVRIVSVFGRKWYFDSIRIDSPVVQVFVDKNGRSNLPTFKSSGHSSNTSIFDLGIRHAILANGVVLYNDRPSALTVDLREVQFDATYNSLINKYSGTLSYSDGRVNYAGTQAPPHALSVQFDATPTTFHLSPAKVQSGYSQLVLTATLENYSAPIVQAQYNSTVDGHQLATLLGDPSIPSGLVLVSGSAQYQSAAGSTIIQSLVVNGDLKSAKLFVKTPALRTEVTNVAAHYSLNNGDATLRDFRASLLGGVVTAQGTMKSIGGDSHSQFNAAVHGISLATLNRSTNRSAPTGPAVVGVLNATATAAWGKTFDDLVAHSDATVTADVSGANADIAHLDQRGASPAAANLPRQNAVTTPRATGPVPIRGAVHATYSGKSQELAVDNSYFRTPQTSLNMNGTVSRNSSLAIQLQANDLRELEAIADLFRSPAPGQTLQPLGLAGTATFNGVVQGSTAAPHLTGQLNAQNLQIDGSSWKLLRTGVDASPSEVNLEQAELDPASQGHLTLNASAQLSKWSFSKTSPIHLQLNASQLDIGQLTKLVGQDIPVTGILSANLDIHGSVMAPDGTGSVTVTKAVAYGEPISSAHVSFDGSGNQANAKLSISAPAGNVDAKLTVSQINRTYSAELTSSGIHLDKLQSIGNGQVSGTVNINVKGHGTFDNPELDATVRIPSLIVQQQTTISDIQLDANVADHRATLELTSSAVGASIKANAKVALTGDYPVEATLDTQNFQLGPLLAAYAPGDSDGITGQTELHATLHGPLKDKQQLEAHLTIPTLKLAYSNTVQLAAASPIHVDYKGGVITVQRSSITGTNTNLRFQGTIPTAGGASMSLLLLGTVDLQLVHLFDPDLRTSGQIRFNVNSYGAGNGSSFGGNIDLVDASVSSPDLPVALERCNGSFAVRKDRISVTQFKGDIGGGTLTAQGGMVLRPSIQFDFGVAAHDVRMLYPQGMRESINANIRLTGSTTNAMLGGNVDLADISFTNAFDLNSFINQFSSGVEAPPSQGFSNNIALNLAVRSSNNVSLVSRTLSVDGSANLQVRGTASRPVILGRANLSGGDIILNGTRFVLNGGIIQFVNPSVTEPVVNLTATTTIQQYNISLRFLGPIDEMRTQYTSDPSLPSADIIHLLAFGQTTEASAASATPASQTAETIIANQVSSQVTGRISKVAGISQLSINPVLANSNSQGPAGANITVQQRVTSNLFVTFSSNVTTTQGQTIQGQYQISPRVAVSVTRDPNGGVAVDTQIKKTW